MEPPAVVEGFNVVEDLSLSFSAGVIRLAIDPFLLERAKETLHGRVIISSTYSGGKVSKDCNFHDINHK